MSALAPIALIPSLSPRVRENFSSPLPQAGEGLGVRA